MTGDEDRLRQVLANLIGNVSQHTPRGTPVEIALGTQPGAETEIRPSRSSRSGTTDRASPRAGGPRLRTVLPRGLVPQPWIGVPGSAWRSSPRSSAHTTGTSPWPHAGRWPHGSCGTADTGLR
ncbi:ATP-binding protein [Oerskovia sp. M15]